MKLTLEVLKLGLGAVAFNLAALPTNEMRERIAKMVPNSAGITIKTLHSFCAGILRVYISELDGFDSHFSVYDSSDQDKLLKKVIKI